MPLTFSMNNINWDGNLLSSYLLSSDNGANQFILAGGISTEDLTALNALVDQYDSTPTAPIAATAGYQDVFLTPTPVGATATGLANDATVYTATVVVSGTSYPVTVTGSAAQTYTTLLAQINADLTGAVAALTANSLRITTSATGLCTSVVITDGLGSYPLFYNLFRNAAFGAPVAGSAAFTTITPTYGKFVVNFTNVTNPTGLSGYIATSGYQQVVISPATMGSFVSALAADDYDFDITIDGGALQQLFITTAGTEDYDALAALMSAQVVGGTVSYSTPDSAFVFTSSSTGATSTVLVAAGTFGSTGGDFFTALMAADTVTATYATAVPGLDADTTTYIAQFTFDGVAVDVSVLGSDAQTFATLATEVQTDLAAAFPGTTAMIVGTTLVVQAPASVQRVRLTNNPLFAATGRWNGTVAYDAAATLKDALSVNRANTGETWLDYLSDNMANVGCYPVHPARRVNVYSDGTFWYWFANNALTSVVPPPAQ